MRDSFGKLNGGAAISDQEDGDRWSFQDRTTRGDWLPGSAANRE
jgi:hypothetical protein